MRATLPIGWAQDVGYTARWVRTIVHRFHQQGEQGIGNHRLTLPGATPLLTTEQQALQEPPEDEGLWSGLKVALWMQERIGHPVDPRRGWEYLQRLGERHACSSSTACSS